MIGNDVVDLADPEAQEEALNPRFDERVFSSEERRRLAASNERHVLRWTMWAAKESAYKLAKRNTPQTIFAHSSFETDLDANGFGSVQYGSWSCAASVKQEGGAIHATVINNEDDFERIVAGIERLPRANDPSVQVRELAQNSLAHHLDIDLSTVTITSGPDRIPELRADEVPNGHLSLSHHGAFIAFAWVPPISPNYRTYT